MAKLVEIDKIWKLLATIPDPEIPVISIVDLGIIRKVEREGDQLVISITSTYTGCPAMKFIEKEIILLLEQGGYKNVAIKMTLSPPWTTDWINTEAMEKLREEGIYRKPGYLCPNKLFDVLSSRVLDPETIINAIFTETQE